MMLSKRVIKIFAQASVGMLMLAACTRERFDNDGPGAGHGNPQGSEFIVAFDLQVYGEDGNTRASYPDIDDNTQSGDLIWGSEDEHGLHSIGSRGNYAFFFLNGRLMTIANITLQSHTHNTGGVGGVTDPVLDDDGKPTGDDQVVENIEARYESRITVEESPEGEKPTSCLVILNANAVVEAQLTEWKEKIAEKDYKDNLAKQGYEVKEIMEKLKDANEDPYKIGRNTFIEDSFLYSYYTMTNTIYVAKDEDGKEFIQSDVRIPPELIQPVKTFDPKKVLVVRVERMVSKFSFKITPNEEMETSGTHHEVFHLSRTPDIVWFEDFKAEAGGEPAPYYLAKYWQVEITGWSVNALENSSFLFKKISQDGYEDGTRWDGWNDSFNYRTYWAEDITYDREKYPWQYRSGGYKPVGELPYYSYENPDDVEMTLLSNYSFAELSLGKKATTDDIDKHFTRDIYAPESTYDASKVRGKHDDRDEMLAATHLLVGAELQIEKEKGSKKFEALDAYRDRNGFFYGSEREYFAVQVHAFNMLLKSQLSMEYTYYKWNELGDKYRDLEKNEADKDGYFEAEWSSERNIRNGDKMAAKPSDVSVYYDDDDLNNYNNNPFYDDPFDYDGDPYGGDYEFSLYWVDETGENYTQLTESYIMDELNDEDFIKDFGGLAIGNIPNGDGQRLPWPAKGKIVIWNKHKTPVFIYTNDIQEALKPTARKELRYASDNDVKSLLYEWIGPVDHFSHGKMYYSHGIEQMPSRVDNSVVDEEGRPKSLTGHFGVVRNNWYQFRLSKINSIGVPVDDIYQPIVPDRATPHDQINVSVTILDWHYEATNTPNLF